ncbi:MAG: porphobilinogen synthase [Halobacteriota archaeon]
MSGYPSRRPRRLRREGVREMVSETKLSADDLVQPLFFDANLSEPREIPSMPGVHRHPVEAAAERAGDVRDAGVPAVMLFGVPETKDERGSRAWADDGVVQRAVREIKEHVPGLVVVTDLCLCEYTTHGHCGVHEDGDVENDATLPLLREVAKSQAAAGADVVAPSGMIDGAVGAIREALDASGHTDVGVMSYSVKYASAFYGPFRDAADSAPAEGDRTGYQMDPANSREALVEARLDVEEGADWLMVKPALSYLDIVSRVTGEFDVPVAAYNVSGEYAMLKAAEREGWLDARDTAVESLLSIKRAGADVVISYWAESLADSGAFD